MSLEDLKEVFSRIACKTNKTKIINALKNNKVIGNKDDNYDCSIFLIKKLKNEGTAVADIINIIKPKDDEKKETTKSKVSAEKRNEYQKRYYQKHNEKMKAYNKQLYQQRKAKKNKEASEQPTSDNEEPIESGEEDDNEADE